MAAQTARDSAYDTWLTAKRAVTNAALFAPFDGIVTSMTTTAVGDTVGITDGVTVIDPTSTYFQMDVDESDVGKMSIGKPVTVTLDAFSGQKFDGSIAEIGYVSKLSSTGATVYSVKVKLPAEIEAKVRIGMNGDGEVVLGESKNVLQLPAEAVIDSQVILPGKEGKKIKIETGLEGDNNVEIKSGLKAGDVVVIK